MRTARLLRCAAPGPVLLPPWLELQRGALRRTIDTAFTSPSTGAVNLLLRDLANFAVLCRQGRPLQPGWTSDPEPLPEAGLLTTDVVAPLAGSVLGAQRRLLQCGVPGDSPLVVVAKESLVTLLLSLQRLADAAEGRPVLPPDVLWGLVALCRPPQLKRLSSAEWALVLHALHRLGAFAAPDAVVHGSLAAAVVGSLLDVVAAAWAARPPTAKELCMGLPGLQGLLLCAAAGGAAIRRTAAGEQLRPSLRLLAADFLGAQLPASIAVAPASALGALSAAAGRVLQEIRWIAMGRGQSERAVAALAEVAAAAEVALCTAVEARASEIAACLSGTDVASVATLALRCAGAAPGAPPQPNSDVVAAAVALCVAAATAASTAELTPRDRAAVWWAAVSVAAAAPALSAALHAPLRAMAGHSAAPDFDGVAPSSLLLERSTQALAPLGIDVPPWVAAAPDAGPAPTSLLDAVRGEEGDVAALVAAAAPTASAAECVRALPLLLPLSGAPAAAALREVLQRIPAVADAVAADAQRTATLWYAARRMHESLCSPEARELWDPPLQSAAAAAVTAVAARRLSLPATPSRQRLNHALRDAGNALSGLLPLPEAEGSAVAAWVRLGPAPGLDVAPMADAAVAAALDTLRSVRGGPATAPGAALHTIRALAQILRATASVQPTAHASASAVAHLAATAALDAVAAPSAQRGGLPPIFAGTGAEDAVVTVAAVLGAAGRCFKARPGLADADVKRFGAATTALLVGAAQPAVDAAAFAARTEAALRVLDTHVALLRRRYAEDPKAWASLDAAGQWSAAVDLPVAAPDTATRAAVCSGLARYAFRHADLHGAGLLADAADIAVTAGVAAAVAGLRAAQPHLHHPHCLVPLGRLLDVVLPAQGPPALDGLDLPALRVVTEAVALLRPTDPEAAAAGLGATLAAALDRPLPTFRAGQDAARMAAVAADFQRRVRLPNAATTQLGLARRAWHRHLATALAAAAPDDDPAAALTCARVFATASREAACEADSDLDAGLRRLWGTAAELLPKAEAAEHRTLAAALLLESAPLVPPLPSQWQAVVRGAARLPKNAPMDSLPPAVKELLDAAGDKQRVPFAAALSQLLHRTAAAQPSQPSPAVGLLLQCCDGILSRATTRVADIRVPPKRICIAAVAAMRASLSTQSVAAALAALLVVHGAASESGKGTAPNVAVSAAALLDCVDAALCPDGTAAPEVPGGDALAPSAALLARRWARSPLLPSAAMVREAAQKAAATQSPRAAAVMLAVLPDDAAPSAVAAANAAMLVATLTDSTLATGVHRLGAVAVWELCLLVRDAQARQVGWEEAQGHLWHVALPLTAERLGERLLQLAVQDPPALGPAVIEECVVALDASDAIHPSEAAAIRAAVEKPAQ